MNALHGFVGWILNPLGALVFLAVITVVVFFHELGHFLVARAFGVKVDVFSVGFGKEIVGFSDRRGTRWRLSWLPIGGYVRFAGDADAASKPDVEAAASMSTAERASTLMFKPVGQRALVAAAGPFANFVLAITMLTGLMMYNGTTVILPMISHVTKGGPAEAAGIKAGDRIIRIGSTEITDFRQVAAIVSASKGIALEIGLNRGGHDMAVTAAPRQMQVRGDDGKVVSGVMLGLSRDPKAEMHVSYSPLGAVGAACSQAWETVKNTFLMIGQILTGGGGAEQLSGPVGIAHVTQQVAEFGFLPLLQLVAFLSVSIGLANLFPIPLLDGGHLLYYAVEAVLGRPLGERAQEAGFRFGLVLVLGLMLLVTWNDLARLNLF